MINRFGGEPIRLAILAGICQAVLARIPNIRFFAFKIPTNSEFALTDQANDVRKVLPMPDQTITNINQAGVTGNIKAFTADAGYFSEGNKALRISDFLPLPLELA